MASSSTDPREATPTSQSRPRMHTRTATGYIPAAGQDLKEVFPGKAAAWKAAMQKSLLGNTVPEIEASIVQHVQHSLARAPFNMDDVAAFSAVALSCRDRLLDQWNATQTFYTQQPKVKRVYYLSLEFLMGKSLDNALLNMQLKPQYVESVKDLGFSMEDLLDCERDAGLGNGGLGRLAACYMDSLSTCSIPAWGYGLRYQYGIFQQALNPDGTQLEIPDPWLDQSNPWEIPRLDTTVTVRFYGHAERASDGTNTGKWLNALEVLAVPYDCPIPGYGTNNMNNIRFWAAKPKRAFDLASFNSGDYDGAVAESQNAENITSVLYPNDNFYQGKELRLKQQYFWVAASLADIIRRWKKTQSPWSTFHEAAAIQLNDTHPTMAIVELMRILIDEESIPFDDAWNIVEKTFGYTNHTVLAEALEQWPVPLIQNLLPRHMAIIFDINLKHLRQVEKRFPGDREKLRRMSLIEEGHPQQVRMANLAVVMSHRVNGVAELHSKLVKDMFRDFVEFYGPDKFTNVTNGITPRRWLLQCNPGLANLVTDTLKSNKWITDLKQIKGIEKFAEDKDFQKKFYEVKLANKARLAEYITRTTGLPIRADALFDVQVKRIHEYKRQAMNILGCIYRYEVLKKLSPADRKKVVPRVSIFGGKAAPGYFIAKLIIRLINAVSKVVNADKEIGDIFQVVFLPDYSVSLAEIIIPASDISEHISTAGTEASGTSNMKFALNGGLILGTVDGANIEIAEEVGEDQVFFFGHLADDIEGLRHKHFTGDYEMPAELKMAIEAIRSGTYGDPSIFDPLISTLTDGNDHYLLGDDFPSYLAAQRMVDEAFVNKEAWIKKCILTTSRMGKFSSDRCVLDYADSIWNVEPVPVPESK